MNKMNIIIFASGNGTNFEAIVKAQQEGVIQANISLLVCNKPNANVLKIAEENNIDTLIKEYKKSEESREDYYQSILNELEKYSFQLVVLAGWMLIVTPKFIDHLQNRYVRLINLHPALPGKFPGINSIERAFEEHQNTGLNTSGLMVHYVDAGVDTGKVINTENVPIYTSDTLETFKKRMQYFEKPLLINSINQLCSLYSRNARYIKSGKVSDIYQVYEGDKKLPYLVMNYSDRLSAFNRQICEIPGKGIMSSILNYFWKAVILGSVTNIEVPYHYKSACICSECKPIKLEIIIRGYISGSLWRRYEKGERHMYGYDFPDGLKKYDKLETPIITPTLKNETDDAITIEEILEQKIVTKEELDDIFVSAEEIYDYGQYVCRQIGLILADTKYEFGYNDKNQIILIDELHTFDNSRYWLKETYKSNLEKGLKPDSLDKDIMRDWLIENNHIEPTQEIKDKVFDGFYKLCELVLKFGHNHRFAYDYYTFKPIKTKEYIKTSHTNNIKSTIHATNITFHNMDTTGVIGLLLENKDKYDKYDEYDYEHIY